MNKSRTLFRNFVCGGLEFRISGEKSISFSVSDPIHMPAKKKKKIERERARGSKNLKENMQNPQKL